MSYTYLDTTTCLFLSGIGPTVSYLKYTELICDITEQTVNMVKVIHIQNKKHTD